MHANEADVIDEAEISCLLVPFVVEESGDTLDVLCRIRFEGELLHRIAAGAACCADVVAIGILDAETDAEAGATAIVARFFHENGGYVEDELVASMKVGICMDSETFSVQQFLVTQQNQPLGVPQVGRVASCGIYRHHVVIAVHNLNLFIYRRVSVLQMAVDFSKVFRMTIIVNDGGIEL